MAWLFSPQRYRIQRATNSAVLNSSPCPPPPLFIFCMSLLVNTPDSGHQLIRSALCAWTVFRLTCSLHSVHCSLLPEQGISVEVYFTSEHSFVDLRCATSSRTDECDIIYLCKYIQFWFMKINNFERMLGFQTNLVYKRLVLVVFLLLKQTILTHFHALYFIHWTLSLVKHGAALAFSHFKDWL